MYLNSFVPKTKHNCGCISQVCIYKGIFRFWSAFCGLLGDKCSIASSCLVHKTSTVHMAFLNSLRGAKQLLREAYNPRNGAKQILRDSKHLLRETNKPSNGAKQILRDSKQLLRETNKPSNGAIQIQTLGKVTENLLYADTLKVSSGALIEVMLLFRYSTTDREAPRVLALFGHLSEWQFN